MKAIIVKNDNFETIGFQVSIESTTVFNWGISASSFYFCKEVSAKKYCTTIFELVKMQTKLHELKNFMSRFFQCVKDSKDANKDCGYNLGSIDEEIKQLEARIQRTINEII